MSDDLASLGIQVDASQVDAAATKLDSLSRSADGTEKAVGSLGNATERLRAQLQAAGVDAATIEKQIALMGATAQKTAAGFTATAAAQTAATAQASASTATQVAANTTLAASLGALGSASVRAAATQVAAQQTMAAAATASAATQVAANTNVAVSQIATSRAVSESLVLLRELSVGNYTRMAGSATILLKALGLLGAVLGPLVGIAAAVGGAFALVTNQINSGAQGTGDLTRGLGLSGDQLDRVKNKYVSFTDTFKAFFQVIGDEIGSSKIATAWQATLNFIGEALTDTLKGMIGDVLGGVRVIEEAWKALPVALGGEGSTAGINFSKAFQSGLDDASKGVDKFFEKVSDRARQNASNRILKEAGAFPSDTDGAVDSAEKMIQKLNDETAAQAGLNDQVTHAAIDVQVYNDAQKLYQQTASEIARIEKDDNLTAEAKAALINRLILAQSAYNNVLKEQAYIEATVANDNQIDQLNTQLSLVSANSREAAVAMASLKAQQEALAKGFDPEQAANYEAELVIIANKQVDLKNRTDEYNESLRAQADLMDELAHHAQDMASGLAQSLGSVGTAISDLTNAYTNHATAQSVFAEKEAALVKLREQGENTTKQEIQLSQEKEDADTSYYANTLGAAKEFFAQGSAGYKLLQAAETAYRVYQLASSIAGIAAKEAETAAVVAANTTQTASAATTAVANAAADVPFPFNLGAIATIVAVMAGFGILAGGGGGSAAATTAPIDPAKQLQAQNGAGSVLGDTTAKSDSIAKSLDQLAKDTNTDLEYSSQMVISLKGIQQGIGSLTSLLARQLQVGGLFNTANLGLGSSSSSNNPLGGIPILGALTGSLFGSSSSSTTLLDQGIRVLSTTVGQAVQNGIAASAYQTTQTQSHSSALFGLISSSSTSTKTINTPLSSDFTNTISNIISGLRGTILDAANKLGVQGAQDVVDSFAVNLGSISFKDLTGSEIKDALNAVFSKLGDDLASAAVPIVNDLQQVGEGALETLSRLVQEYQVVDDAAKTVGFTFSQVGVDSLAARDRLIQVSGGLDNFSKQASFFVDNFESSADALRPIAKAVADEMARLGYAGITTKAQFSAIVQSLDTSTDAGAALYAALQNVAPAFAKVADAAQDLADKRTDLEIQLLQATGDELGATALQRQKELNALDASLVPLQKAIYAAQDLATAQGKLASSQSALTTAQNNLVNAQKAANATTQQSIDKFNGFVISLTQFQTSLATGALGGNNILRQYASSRAAFQVTAAAASAGDPTALANFQNIAGAFLTASQATSPSQLVYLRDVAAVRNATTAAINAAQHQIDINTQQLYAINNVNDSVQSVADAINALAEAQADYNQKSLDLLAAQRVFDLSNVPGHAGGLSYVPYDNYVARLHKGERVLTANENNAYNSKDMLEELRKMRVDVTKQTKTTNDLLRRFTSDGETLNVTVAS